MVHSIMRRANTNDINRVSLRGAERRSNLKQRRDCRALRARNDCNDNYFVCIIEFRISKGTLFLPRKGRATSVALVWEAEASPTHDHSLMNRFHYFCEAQ